MRTSLYLCTALVGLWLASGAVGRMGSPGSFMLEVPAQDLSVGQQFEPRLVPTSAPTAGTEMAPPQAAPAETAPPPAVPAETVALELLDASGHPIASQTVNFTGGAAAVGKPWSLPRDGVYRVRASAPSGAQTVSVSALPEPSSNWGGVTALASWGVPAGAAAYLREHGFVVTEVDTANAATALAADPLIVVGDPRLQGGDLTAAYTALWRAVDQGARLLVLEPPPPGVRPYWPVQAPLRAATGACDDWASLAGGWAPAPQLAFDLDGKSALDIYHWDGTYVARAKDAGYPGCHTLFSVRYGEGWVTLTTVPLLQHFQDVRARLDLMTLIKASMRRMHRQPSSPGLAWVMQQRLAALARTPPNPLTTDAAVWYWPPPAAIAPAAVLAPAASDGNPQTCWTAPAAGTAGATARLDLDAAQPVHSLTLSFGAEGGAWPAIELAASHDGVHWIPLTAPAIAADGTLSVPVPAAGGTANWRDFQFTVTSAPARGWRLCEFSAH